MFYCLVKLLFCDFIPFEGIIVHSKRITEFDANLEHSLNLLINAA